MVFIAKLLISAIVALAGFSAFNAIDPPPCQSRVCPGSTR